MAETDTTNFVDRIVDFFVVNEGEERERKSQKEAIRARRSKPIFASLDRVE
jgi:hypothetical protein